HAAPAGGGMTQRQIDLLPDAIRARSQAGVVAGRYVAAMLIGVVLLGLTATHSRLMLDLARERLRVAEEQANIVLAAEAKAAQLRRSLNETRDYIRRYEKIALPVEVSRVVATIINELPASATIDRVDLQAGARQRNRSTRSRGTVRPDEPLPRVLMGDISGFAATDQDVAEIVANLEGLRLFEQVSLDFSRTRVVRERNAREFRISIRADLDVRYDVEDSDDLRVREQQEAAAHVE
ncbi:MAG: PilN domain-containing protein, partial [Planctomycetota bacterium]